MTIEIKTVVEQDPLPPYDPPARLPYAAHEDDACHDLYASEDAIIPPFGRATISVGLKMAIPQGYKGHVYSRSGLASKYGVFTLNAPGVVDAGYRGTVKVVLANFSPNDFAVREGDRIAQFAIEPVTKVRFVEVDTLDETDRGEGGFGSTGK